MNNGSDPLTLLAAIMLVFFLASLAWGLLASAAQVEPRMCLCLALVNALLAGSLATHAMRGLAPAWLTYWSSDVMAIAAIALLRASMPALTEPRLAWRSALLVLSLAAGGLAQLPYDGDMHRESRLIFASMSVLTVLASLDAWRQLRARVDVGLSALLAGPLFFISAMMLARLLESLLRPGETTDVLDSGAFNLAWLWSMLGMNLIMNATMALLVMAKLILRIQRLTRHDPLTGVLNRRALSEAIELEHTRLQRGRGYALVMIDMDHFKQLNDSLGHAAGDAALKRAVEVLSLCVRDIDRLGRLGGEEFCVLLPLTDLAGALLVAERMRHNLEHSAFEWAGKTWPLTASFGIAEGQPDDISADAVLRRADQGMYQAKSQGRNLVQAT
ncbi:GGDEF domain-containing protein [Paucibacter sp. AS339]|uniref:GGDEF domain-containing protein n=1 Tax=Paucibacter hankyongi TaxID=3133434 RepID=UPI0030A94DFA